MQRVYRESFLNISVTASRDSTMGLYYHDRVPSTLWEDEINVKVDGTHGLKNRSVARSSGNTVVSPGSYLSKSEGVRR